MSAPDSGVLPDIRSESFEGAAARHLHELWETSPGLMGFFGTVDHKTLGIRYIVTAFAFLIAGGIEALVMRVQLAEPNMTILTPAQYDQLFSMHGITMIFLYAQPVLAGFSVFLFPLLLGTRDMAFPRMNALSYWVFLAAGIFMYTSFIVQSAPNDGWFDYPPYASKAFNPGLNIDFYCLGMELFSLSMTLGAVNFIVTVLRLRAPGMTIARMPVIIWGTFSTSIASVLAQPAVMVAVFLLWMDRNFGTSFFQGGTGQGAQPLLWQHLFWIFAHPWVYIIVLPAQGMISDILPTFCRRPLCAFTLVVLATISTMLLGFGVWVHHMFATGIPWLGLAFFSAASFIITIPSGVQVFAWIATIWTGRPVMTTSFHYAAAFIAMFVIGGVSGVMTASVPADLQLTDSYFVVAHIHYVLIGINMFGVLAGLYYWFPKFSGRMLDETLGKISFWIVFVGFNTAFLPMHWTGLMGMPRRIYTYPPGVGWTWLNLTTTIGAFILAFGLLLVLINVLRSLRSGRIAGANPWDAPTLEWSVPSPPPPYNFVTIPVIATRHPLWEDRIHEGAGRSSLSRGPYLGDGKQALGTTAIDADPDVVLPMAEDDISPFLITVFLMVFLYGLLVHFWALAGGAVAMVLLGILWWMWPRKSLGQRTTRRRRRRRREADHV